MKLDEFDYFLGLQSMNDLLFFNYVLVDLSWRSSPETAMNIKEAYQLLIGTLLEEDKKVLFSYVPKQLISKKFSEDNINNIIKNVELEKGIIYEGKERNMLIDEVNKYLSTTNFFPIPPEIITKMNMMYNEESIKHSITNPFLYQP